MYIYNSYNKQLERFDSIEDKKVKLYTCGPTVYNYAHIGNLRTYIFEDILKRSLEYNGYLVKHVMNITDVGHLESDDDYGLDKMQIAYNREKKSPHEISQYYEKCFFNDCAELNIKRPEIIARATKHISEMIDLVKLLEQKGYTYISNKNVYFSVDKFPQYGKMSNINLTSNLKSRVEFDIHKKNQYDFVLWFVNSKYENHILEWDSPWGKGYPGWHLECSAMAMKYLGERIDIHCGGIDHISVHHPNEIAQSEAALGHKWVNYWLHGEFLVVDDKKMSKSSDEFLTLDVLKNKGFTPLDYRFFCLNSHYRKQLTFNELNIKNAQNSYTKLLNKINNLVKNEQDEVLNNVDLIQVYKEKFIKYLNNDLNTANCISLLYSVLDEDRLYNKEKLMLIKEFDKVLGINLIQNNEESLHYDINIEEINNLINIRNNARNNRDFKEADKIREYLFTKNIILIDTPDGTKWDVIK